MTFNCFDYIGLPEDDAYSLAGYNGFKTIVVKRWNDHLYQTEVYEGSSVSNIFDENRITLIVNDTNTKFLVTDCYIG